MLVDLVDEHSEAIEYDLIRAGARLRDWPYGGVSWRDLYVMVRQAQPDSATYKALNPQWQASNDVELMRSMDLHLRILAWQQTVDGQKGRNVPQLVLWPWEQPALEHDVMDWDEAAAFLGWESEMSRFFD